MRQHVLNWFLVYKLHISHIKQVMTSLFVSFNQGLALVQVSTLPSYQVSTKFLTPYVKVEILRGMHIPLHEPRV